jgi:tetratricopeptide (TPR) repeat protein
MQINSNSILHKAEQCLKNEDKLGAIRYLKMFVNNAPKYHPHLHIANYNLGRVYLETNNINEAIEYLSKSIEINKTFIQGIITLADILSSINHYEQALPLFKKAINLMQKRLEVIITQSKIN